MLYLLDKDVRTVKWNGIPLHEASSAIVKEEVNGDFVLTVRYPITDSSIYQLIKEDMLIKAPAPVLGAQLFRIKKHVENDDSLDITAYHISDDVMQRSINPVSVVGQGCAMALSQMVQNAKTDLGTFSFTSDIMDSRTFNTTETETLYSVLMDGKHSIVGTWEGELVRDNFAMSIKRSRGADRGVVITTHKNLKSYQRTKNSQSVVTRIHAKSTFKAEGAEEETTITVTVDSPLIGNYPYINEKDYENNNAKTVDELRKWAEAKFKNEGIDKISDAIEIEAYELDGQVIHLGDTVNIKSKKHSVDIYKKAIAYEYNALTEEYISITFDDKPGVGGSGVSSGLSNAADAILNANQNAQEIAVERAIKNANQAFDAEFEKRAEEINDGIKQSKAEAERYADAIKQEIDTEIAQVEQSMQSQAQEHDRQVADILSKTQSIESLANQAKSDAASAIARANQVKTEAIADARAQVAMARQALNTAKSELQTAIASADQKARDSQASATALRNDLNLQASKILEQARAQTALTNRVTTVETLADGTRSTVAELSRTMQEATQNIASVTSRTRTVEDTLSQTRSQYEVLTQTVNVQTGQIESINRKTADLQSGINGVTERFENLQVGARNYAEDYDFSRSMWEFSQGDSSATERSTDNGIYTLTTTTNTWHQLQIHSESGSRLGGKKDSTALLELEVGETYTLSVEAKVNSGNPQIWIELRDNGFVNYNNIVTHFGGSGKPLNVTSEWVRYSVTGTVKPNSDFGHRRIILGYNEIGSISFRKVELSRGTKPMDTGPAVEDTEGRVETLRSELGTYIRSATENSAELIRRIETADGKAVDAKTYAQQTAEGFKTRLESLETYKNEEGTRASQYLTASREETARQLTAERTAIATNYVAKSTYDENVRGTTLKLNDIKTTADTAKQNLATYQNTVDRKLTELISTTQTLDGKINTASAKITQNANEISKRLTSTQVDKAITDKGYQTKSDVDNNITGRGYITNSTLQPYALSTTVQNLVKETSDSFSRTISETRALIPTEVGSRNLIRGSAEMVIGSGRWQDGTFRKSGTGIIKTINVANSPVPNVTKGIEVEITSATECGIAQDTLFMPKGTYTFTVWVKGPIGATGRFDTFNGNGSSSKIFRLTGGWDRLSVTSTSTVDETKNISYVYLMTSPRYPAKMHIVAPKLEAGPIPTAWSPAPEDLATVTALHDVSDTVDSHTRTIGAIGETGSILDNVSKVTQTANGLVTEVSGEGGLKTQVSTLAGSYAIKNLTSSGTVLNQLNLNKDGSVKIDGKLVQITGTTYIQDGVITSAKIAGLDAGKINTGELNAARIKANSIDGSKIVFDQAFLNKMTANEAYLQQLFAKDAFLTAVQAVSISASQITGGLMRATNGAMEIDFNNSAIDMFKDGAIRFHSGSNAIYRQSTDGIHTAFVHFDTTSKGGIYASLGSTSSRDGINSKSSGRFAGIRVARTSERSDSHVASQDAVELYGDTIFFGHGFEGGGFSMHTTLTGGRTISLNKMHDALINLCRCWIHLRNEGFNLNSSAFRKSLDTEIHNAQQLYNTIERIT
ncbi:TPA: phage tail spike protein [Streptococcus suis]